MTEASVFQLIQNFPHSLQEEIRQNIIDYTEYLYYKHLKQLKTSKTLPKKNASGLSAKDRLELKRRVKNAKEHPEKLVTWEQIIQSLEKKHGRKIQI